MQKIIHNRCNNVMMDDVIGNGIKYYRAIYIATKNNKRAHVNNNAVFESLQGKRVMNNVVRINNMGDLHPFENGPQFLAHTIFMNYCNKNFVYYWLDKNTFPRAKLIYLNSHPCESSVVYRFNSYQTAMYLVGGKAKQKRWGNSDTNHIEKSTYDLLESTYSEESLIVSPKIVFS